jgi:hypothetical protein
MGYAAPTELDIILDDGIYKYAAPTALENRRPT